MDLYMMGDEFIFSLGGVCLFVLINEIIVNIVYKLGSHMDYIVGLAWLSPQGSTKKSH